MAPPTGGATRVPGTGAFGIENAGVEIGPFTYPWRGKLEEPARELVVGAARLCVVTGATRCGLNPATGADMTVPLIVIGRAHVGTIVNCFDVALELANAAGTAAEAPDFGVA